MQLPSDPPSDPLLPPGAGHLVVSLISDDPVWRTRRRILQHVLSQPDGICPGRDELGYWVGRSGSSMWRPTQQLAVARVLELGPRRWRQPRLLAVNPAVLQWRDVPWLVTREELRLRLRAIGLEGAARAFTALPDRVKARLPMSRVHSNEVASPYVARSLGGSAADSAGFDPESGESTRVYPGVDARSLSDNARGDTSSLEVLRTSFSFEGGEGGVLDPHPDPESEFEDVLYRVLAKARETPKGERYLGGRPRQQLRELVDRFGRPVVLEGLAAAPTGRYAPTLVEHLRVIVHGNAYLAEEAARAGQDVVGERMRNLREVLAVEEEMERKHAERVGVEPDFDSQRLRELRRLVAECENGPTPTQETG